MKDKLFNNKNKLVLLVSFITGNIVLIVEHIQNKNKEKDKS